MNIPHFVLRFQFLAITNKIATDKFAKDCVGNKFLFLFNMSKNSTAGLNDS